MVVDYDLETKVQIEKLYEGIVEEGIGTYTSLIILHLLGYYVIQ